MLDIPYSSISCIFALTLQNKVSKVTLMNKAMKRKEAKNAIFEMCPVRNVIARFGNKWAFLVLLVIGENGVVRYNELCRLIPDVSSRVLSTTLKTLEADGLISRKVYPVVPPKVEYSLTEIGESLLPLITQLTMWAQTNMKRIIDHRNVFDAQAS